jgi:hypothetical protein
MTSEWARDNFFMPQIVMGCGLAIAFTGLVALLAQNALDAGALSSPFNLLIRPFVGKSSEARLALDVQGHIAGVARALGSTSTLVNGAQFRAQLLAVAHLRTFCQLKKQSVNSADRSLQSTSLTEESLQSPRSPEHCGVIR